MPGPLVPQRQDRILELDGLRGIACAMVLLWHLVAGQIPDRPGAWGGLKTALSQTWSGVDLFFVLSGYLIIRNLNRDSGRAGWVRRFVAARAFRLVPAYGLLLVGAALTSAWVARSLYVSNTQRLLVQDSYPLWTFLYFGQNWYPVFAHVRHPLGSNFLSSTWSLGAEIEFYVGSAFLFLSCPPERRLRALVWAAVAAEFFRFLIVVAYPNPSLTAFILPPARMDGFALGGCAALWLENPLSWEKTLKRMGTLTCCWAALFSLVLILTVNAEPFAGGLPALLSYTCFALFYTLSLVLILLNTGSPMFGWLRRGPLAALGVISYGVYLFHLPFHYLFSNALEIPESYLTFAHGCPYLVLELALLFLFSAAVWIGIEKPLIGIGRRVAGSGSGIRP